MVSPEFKVLTKPSSQNVKTFLSKIRETIDNSGSLRERRLGVPHFLVWGPPRGWDQMPSIGLNVQDEMNPPVPIGGFAIDGAAQKSMASRMPKPWIKPSLCPIGIPGDAGECRSVML